MLNNAIAYDLIRNYSLGAFLSHVTLKTVFLIVTVISNIGNYAGFVLTFRLTHSFPQHLCISLPEHVVEHLCVS